MPDTVLVTGAAGFVGGHLLEALATPDPARRVVAWRRPAAGRGPHLVGADHTPGAVMWQDVDLLDRAEVHRRVSDIAPTQVYHCAGVADVGGSWNNVIRTLETNVMGTEHLLDSVRTVCPTARVLVPSSALVYQTSDEAIREDHPIGPVSPYGVSKLAQEMLARCYVKDGPAMLLARSFTHIGPGQDPAYATSSFAHQIARIEAGQAEPTIRVGLLDARRDLTDVRDTVKAYRALMASGAPGTVYNVCSGRCHQIYDVLAGLLDLARVPIAVELDPDRLRSNDPAQVLGDRSRISADVGWEPQIPLADTLRDLLDYWRRAITPSL